MGRWDIKWKEKLLKNNIELEEDGRFVDDARAFLYAIRAGWRWEENGLWFRKEWEDEDALLSPTERTKRAIFESMKGVTKCLKFTVETAEDFVDGWLPTLDFKIRMDPRNNRIEYAFYEKPTTPNRCLQSDTALNHNSLIMALSNEVGRRLDSFSSSMPASIKVEALDKFSQKMVNSGHSIKTIRTILVGGIKGFLRRVARSEAKGEPLHRSAGQSATSRRKKKLLAKTQWFRKTSQEDQDSGHGGPCHQGGGGAPHQQTNTRARGHTSQKQVQGQERGVAGGKSGDSAEGRKLRTTTVLFVEFSKGGAIQKKMRDCLDRLTPMLGFKMRVTEKGGTPLGSLLSNKNLWSGSECGRTTCRTCAQPDESKEPCTLRNIVYESECTVCNPPGFRREADKSGLAEKRDHPSLYVGESARSISERSAEHWRDAESGKEESHMLEHQAESHQGVVPPQFSFRVVKGCKSSLERQVREAVRIQMRGTVLNKKGLYNRCKLTRLVVDEEWEEKVWREAWVPRDPQVNDEWLGIQSKTKRKDKSGGNGKRLKLENDDGVAWGEEVTQEYTDRNTFLYSNDPVNAKKRQGQLFTISGVEWLCRQAVLELADKAVEWAGYSEGVAEWEEWEETEDTSRRVGRKREEEKRLWKILDMLDKEEAKNNKMKAQKAAKKVSLARAKMKADSKQPSISEMFAPGRTPKPTFSKQPGGSEENGGPCHLNGGGAPHQQINTRACGHNSQPANPLPGVTDVHRVNDQGQAEQVQEVVAQLSKQTKLMSDWGQPMGCQAEVSPRGDVQPEKVECDNVGVAQLCEETMMSDASVAQLCGESVSTSNEVPSNLVMGESEGETESDRSKGRKNNFRGAMQKGGKGASSSSSNCPVTKNSARSGEGEEITTPTRKKFHSSIVSKSDIFPNNLRGVKGGGKKKAMGVCTLTPTKRKLIENKNTRSLIDIFEVLPDQPMVDVISESPAKRRRIIKVEVNNPAASSGGDEISS